MRIAVDAMGGDHAPGKIVQGALDAAGCFDGVEVLLAGVPALMKPFLPETIPSNVEIIGCEEIVEMDEPPVEAIKGKKDSSLRWSGRSMAARGPGSRRRSRPRAGTRSSST